MAERTFDDVLARRTVSPALRANGTVNGAAVDFSASGGAQSASVVVATGTITDGSHAVAIEDSPDGSTGWAPIPAAQLQGSPPTVVAADDDRVFEVGILRCRGFARVSITTTGATTGGIVGALILLGECRHRVAH
jgi:hypothetical protein